MRLSSRAPRVVLVEVLAVWIVAYTVVLLLAEEILRRSRALYWMTFAIAPVMLTPFWIQGDHAPFMWAKIYSIIAAALLCAACRGWPERVMRIGRPLFFGILVLNVTEAIIQDLVHARFVSALLGVFVLVAAPSPLVIFIDDADPVKMIYWPMSRVWVALYSVWNWLFIYGQWPEYAGLQCAVLGSSLIIGMIWPKRWLLARSTTLALHMEIAFTRWELFEPRMMTPSWASLRLATALQAASLLLGFYATYVRWRAKRSPAA